jgi:hypothetical protein
MHNEYRLEEDKDANRKDIWQVSLAFETEVLSDITAVANIGMERNSDTASSTHPAFLLGGIIYSVSEILDIDLGIKAGLNNPETNYAFLAGATVSF